MPNPAKIEAVNELNEVFQKAKSVVLTNYQGIDAPSLGALRRYMRDRSVNFLVVKNTLARQASKSTPFEVMDKALKGPVSLIVSYDDDIAPAKALSEYSKTKPEKDPEVICGVVDGKLITPEQVKELSCLPPREVLLAQMLSTFQGPTTNFVGVFSSLLRKLVGTLDAIKDKKETSG